MLKQGQANRAGVRTQALGLQHAPWQLLLPTPSTASSTGLPRTWLCVRKLLAAPLAALVLEPHRAPELEQRQSLVPQRPPGPCGRGGASSSHPQSSAVLGAVPQLQAQDAVRLGRGTAPALGICENTWLKERLLASIQAMLQPPPLLNPSSGWAGPPSTMKKRFKSKLPKNETGFASSVLNRCWNALKTNPSEADAQLLTSFHTRVTCSQRL